MIRLAFAGFRHDHIMDVHARASVGHDIEIVAACEEDELARQSVARAGKVNITHQTIASMLEDVPCDAVAVGDYYGKRGAIIIDALKRGKHVLSDKPLCTSLAELESIRSLAAEKRLQVGLMLDLRDAGQYIKVRELVRSGAIGEVQSVYIGGQHALRLGVRPQWYFEPGKHGGTINDIAIHGFDIIEWITGLRFVEVTAARTWNAFAPDYPHFHDGAQFVMKMDNGCGVIGDVSYFAPGDTGGSRFDPNWRITLWGRNGVIETSHSTPVTVWRNGHPSEVIESPPGDPGGYLRSFVASVEGRECALTTADSLRAAEVALKVQKAADESACGTGV
jgi:predicted dehydrogenase